MADIGSEENKFTTSKTKESKIQDKNMKGHAKILEINPSATRTKPRNIIVGTSGKTKRFVKIETTETVSIFTIKSGKTKNCVARVEATISRRPNLSVIFNLLEIIGER
jgi:hypothetical protein